MSESTTGFGPDLPRKRKRAPFTRMQVILGVAALLVLAVAAWAIVASILPTEGMKREAVREQCEKDALSQLRDPESAIFDLPEPELMENDQGETVYYFDGSVRSRNGFGGMTRTPMGCIGQWDDDKDEATGKAVLLDL
ncbi:hypothetical protein M3G54_01740 [Brevibacterium casei]|uniref:hypothetical protein n=1 Tax=Brevibacterium casei TaxID=33889 RepID=UPI00223AFC80|nr:hypothetical protein [Brevibacterium casei]MCT2357086.1 hypothetical protein [Brevibacterium casei]